MSNMPSGYESYKDNKILSLLGISFDSNQLQQSVEAVKNSCFDIRGFVSYSSFVNSVSATVVQNQLTNNLTITSWQVGEGLAKAYLVNHHNFNFPWPSNRDLKNLKSSLAGADLVGFYDDKFAFGEVKTSSENRHPPQITSKKNDGLNAQLNKLCSDKNLQQTLIQYLYHRVKNKIIFKSAAEKYFNNSNNSNNFNIFGVLVRDTPPNIEDWRYLQNNLQPHNKKNIFLIGLYLPHGGINQLHNLVSTGGGE